MAVHVVKDSVDDSRQRTFGAGLDPVDDSAWAAWRDALEAVPAKTLDPSPRESGKNDRAANTPVAATTVLESTSRFQTDQDFLKGIVQGIREDVLCDATEEAVPAPVIERTDVGLTAPSFHAFLPERASDRQSTGAVLRVVGRSIVRTLQRWAHVARANAAVGRTLTLRTVRRWSTVARIAEASHRFDYYTVAVGGLLVTSVGAVAVSAWLVFQGSAAAPAKLEPAVSAPVPATPEKSDLLTKPQRTVRSELRAVRDFLVGVKPVSSAAVASPKPSTDAPPPEPAQVASGVRRAVPAVNPPARASRSIRQGRSAIGGASDRDKTSAPPANSDADASAPVAAVATIESVAPPLDVPPSTTTSPAPDPAARSVIYDAGDSEVTPPTAAPQQVIGMWSPLAPTDSGGIAVIVNEAGTVDSVRSVHEPRTMAESLQLAAALSSIKSWRFRPATKDNVPVRYRLILPLRATTSP